MARFSSRFARDATSGDPERRLKKVGKELAGLREQSGVVEPQAMQLVQDAENAETRALVSDDGNDARAAKQARRHADNALRRRDEIRARIAELEALQDALLDELTRRRR